MNAVGTQFADFVNIRVYADTKDRATVINLWQQCGLVRPQNDPVKDIQRKLKVRPDLFLVGETKGNVVATVMAGYEGHRGWINYLAVSPGSQRLGIGRLMMNAAEEALRKSECPKISLQVRTSNRAVLEFYRRLGFVPDDVVSLGKRLIQD